MLFLFIIQYGINTLILFKWFFFKKIVFLYYYIFIISIYKGYEHKLTDFWVAYTPMIITLGCTLLQLFHKPHFPRGIYNIPRSFVCLPFGLKNITWECYHTVNTCIVVNEICIKKTLMVWKGSTEYKYKLKLLDVRAY